MHTSWRRIFTWLTLAVIQSFMLPGTLGAQRPQYTIEVTLDTAQHVLRGHMEIVYPNPASAPLDSLGIHLYPNAYRNRNTALVRQMVANGSLRLYRALPRELGSMNKLAFTSAESALQVVQEDDNPDIGWIRLVPPLTPGETIHLSTPFQVNIPLSFSRMGRTGDSYQLTQWYPHLAVLDHDGWHTMPYLDQGEFFNDFADYTVTITAPAGYVIATTGSEVSREELGKATRWTFYAENVIDFAWFASPHFRLETRTLDFPGQESIDLLVYRDTLYRGHWEKAMDLAERALRFYTDWLGPYPYKHMRVVSTPLSRAGFMEYPMIAQISEEADPVQFDLAIAHEIGHTWLYGALANNERVYPWLDEGLNTFIQNRYAARYYPDESNDMPRSFLKGRYSMREEDALALSERATNLMEPPASPPEFQSAAQYYYSAYALPAAGLEILRSRVGEDMVKNMFRRYYADHRFTHVTPADMKQSFQHLCACNLTWFFEGWIYHAHQVDYRIRHVDRDKQEVTIVNKGSAAIPLQMMTYAQGVQRYHQWEEGFAWQKTFRMEEPFDHIRLFADVPGINKNWLYNYTPKPVFPHVTWWPKTGSQERHTVSITPFPAYNETDGFLGGVAVTAGLFPQAHLKWIAVPLYGFGSRKVRGYAEGRYTSDIGKGIFDKLLITASAQQFGFEVDTHYHFRDDYRRFSPSIALRVKPRKDHPHLVQWWRYRVVMVDQHYGTGIDFDEGRFREDNRQYGVHELSYRLHSDYVLRPFTVSGNIQAGQGFIRLNATYDQHFAGLDPYRGLWVHGFAGWLPYYHQPKATVRFSINGYVSGGFASTDYLYDQWLGGRNATDGIFSRQLYPRDANLKTLAINGISEDWMLGGGASLALPFRWIHVYLDAAFYRSGITQEAELDYSGGLSLVLWKDVFQIYLPLTESANIRNSITYEQRDLWHERISFQANIRLANPLDLADRFVFGY